MGLLVRFSKKRNSVFLLLALILYSGCSGYNSNSMDNSKFGSTAQSILIQNCGQCHGDFSLSLVELESKGYLVRGNAEVSEIMLRARGSGLGGAEDMPPSGDSLSADQIEKIKNWINSGI